MSDDEVVDALAEMGVDEITDIMDMVATLGRADHPWFGVLERNTYVSAPPNVIYGISEARYQMIFGLAFALGVESQKRKPT